MGRKTAEVLRKEAQHLEQYKDTLIFLAYSLYSPFLNVVNNAKTAFTLARFQIRKASTDCRVISRLRVLSNLSGKRKSSILKKKWRRNNTMRVTKIVKPSIFSRDQTAFHTLFVSIASSYDLGNNNRIKKIIDNPPSLLRLGDTYHGTRNKKIIDI
jgi:hypothetical protein